MKSAWPLLVLSLLAAAACSSSDSSTPPPNDNDAGSDAGGREVTKLPPLSTSVKLTDTETIVPTHAVAPKIIEPSAMDPAVRDQQLASGFGAFTSGAGEQLTPDGSTPPQPGANRHRLTRFVQMTDLHVTDDESPTRLASFDSGPPFESAWRPQEGHECRILNAAVRTVNRIHKDAPIDFVLLGGDSVDNAQQNELDWVLALLGGADRLACDSGDPDDPVPGPNNDGKDPFAPEGLDVPWYWVTGNHDVLIQGNFAVTDQNLAQSIGSSAPQGTRDYREPGSPITQDDIVADPNRAAMRRATLIDRVVAHTGKAGPPSHGLGDYAKQTKKAFYTADLGTSGVRLIVVDSAAETGYSEGVLRTSDVEAFVKPELARAKTDGKLVIFASHHAALSLADGNGLGGTKQADAITQKDWEDLLTANPHVIGHIAGHSHLHSVRSVAAGAPGVGQYWEIRTSALVDYPHQFRTIEIWDEDNGYLTFRSVAVNYATENDPVALAGRTLGILDYTSHGVGGGQGEPKDRNIILWTKKPAP